MDIVIKRYLTGNVPTLTYIVSVGNKAVIIDPAEVSDKMNEYINENALIVEYVLLTHAHADHFYAARAICDRYSVPAYISSVDYPLLFDNEHNAADILNLTDITPPEKIICLEDNDIIPFCDTFFRFILTPGHTPGSGGFLIDNHFFSGDTIFRDSVGRCDLYGGDMNKLIDSVKTKIYTLPDETVILSGHSARTSVGMEKRNNPFVKA